MPTANGLRDDLPEQVREPQPPVGKNRKHPPALGGPSGPLLGILTPEQLDDAMFR
jgi:hypothetical protein